MGMPATVGDWTVEMLDALPEDGQRYEIIDGELFVTSAPVEFHQDIAGDLFALLRDDRAVRLMARAATRRNLTADRRVRLK